MSTIRNSLDAVNALRQAIRRRMRMSERAGQIEAAAHNNRLVDYHAGCIGMGLCLLEDLDRLKKRLSESQS